MSHHAILYLVSSKHLHNICKTSAQRLQCWSNIVQMFCLYSVKYGAPKWTRVEEKNKLNRAHGL